jgi:hypothetical protein
MWRVGWPERVGVGELGEGGWDRGCWVRQAQATIAIMRLCENRMIPGVRACSHHPPQYLTSQTSSQNAGPCCL